VIDAALEAATAAIVRVAIFIGFATVGGVLVTVAKRGLAIGNSTLTDSLQIGIASGSPIGLVWAFGPAVAAVVHTP